MVGSLKDKIMSLFKTNITKDYCVGNVYGGGKKPRKPKRKIKYVNNIIKDISNLLRLKKGNETIKDRIIRDIKNLSVKKKIITNQ